MPDIEMKKLRIWFIGGMILGIRFLSIECPRNEARNHELERKVELLEQVYIFWLKIHLFSLNIHLLVNTQFLFKTFTKNPAFIGTKSGYFEKSGDFDLKSNFRLNIHLLINSQSWSNIRFLLKIKLWLEQKWMFH